MADYFYSLFRVLICVLAVQSAFAHQPTEPKLDSPSSGRRVALVIGNTNYTRASVPMGLSDAKAMEQVLRQLNFDVDSATNVSRKGLAESIDRFVARLQANDVVVFYFSGHGIQLDGENYLIGIDFGGVDQYDVQYDGYPLARIQERIERSGASLSIFIIEACHENPFHNTKGMSRGLAIESGGRGTFLAFASEPGTVSVDTDLKSNSLFTAHLLAAMEQPGLSLDEIFNKVRVEVKQESNGRQIPIQVSSVSGSYYFIPSPGSAADAFEQGLRLLKEKKPNEAIPYFDHAIGIDPGHLAAHVRKAEALTLLGDDKRAHTDLEEALRLRPVGSDGYFHRALAYISENRFERALIDLNTAISLDKNSTQAHESRALVREHFIDFAGAIEDYDSAIFASPDDISLYRARGRDRSGIGEVSLAIEDFTKVIDSEPSAGDYIYRSGLYGRLKKPDLELVDVHNASQLGSRDPAQHITIGERFLQLGDAASSEKEFRIALQIKPDDADALNALGYTLADRGIRLDEALSLIQQAVQLDKNNYAYLDSLGWVYYRLKDLKKAEQFLKMSLDLQSSPDQLEHLGDVYWAEKHKADAATEWGEALATAERGWKLLRQVPEYKTLEEFPQIIRLRKKLKDAQ
jgi:tetratricopeptide (TPR) repeat protein